MCADSLNWALYGWDSEMDHPPLGRSYLGSSAVVWYVMCPDSLNWWVRSNIWGVDRTDPWGPEMDHPPYGPQLFGSSSAVVWYVMCPDSLNWALWVRFHGRYWYQSFIDGSNIGPSAIGRYLVVDSHDRPLGSRNGVMDRTDPWGPDHGFIRHCHWDAAIW